MVHVGLVLHLGEFSQLSSRFFFPGLDGSCHLPAEVVALDGETWHTTKMQDKTEQ